MYQALYRKYRPRTFSEVVGQEHITGTLRRQVETGRTSHAYLFVGTRGTGKTTCAKILSRAINCEHPVNGDPCNACPACLGIESGSVLDVVEIDAASNNGVDSIRALRDEAIYTPASVRKRVYIVDEVHMLSSSAFNALLKILEEPPEHLVFILATTEFRKIPATILSRCQHFSFKRLEPSVIQKRLSFVAAQEGFGLTEGAAALLARLADGSMRDGLSLLDQCASGDTVDEETVAAAVGLVSAGSGAKLWQALRGDLQRALELFESSWNGGAEPSAVLSDLLSLTRDMLMLRAAPAEGELFISGAMGADELRGLSEGLETGTLLRAAELLQSALAPSGAVRDRRTGAELCLVRLSRLLSGVSTDIENTGPEKRRDASAANAGPAAPKGALPEAALKGRGAAPRERNDERTRGDRAAPGGSEERRRDAAPAKDGQNPWEGAPPPQDGENPWEGAPPPQDGGNPWGDAPKPWDSENPWEDAPKPQDSGGAGRKSASGAEGDEEFWDRVLGACSGKIERTRYQFLADKSNVLPERVGNELVLHVGNDFLCRMLGTPDVVGSVAREATAVLGSSVRVRVTAEPLQRELRDDKLDRLKKFQNVIFE